jgi:monoamine oxidase
MATGCKGFAPRGHWLCALFLLSSILSGPAAAPPKKTEVVIIGAGLSGLAAAYELKQAKVPFHILELAPRVGGRVRTVRYKIPGQPEIFADSGMEEYWESNPAVQVLRELKLPYTSDVALSSLVLDKKLYPLTKGATPQSFQAKLFSESERAALQRFNGKVGPWINQLRTTRPVPPELMKLKDISFEQFVKAEQLPPRVGEWIRISVECEIATHWDRISALDGIAEFHIFLGDGEPCFRVIRGNDRFTQALAKAAGTRRISLNHRVTRIVAAEDKGLDVHYLQTESNENGVINGQYVICTIPLFRLFEVQFVPPLSEKKLEAIQTMSWGSYFKAHVFVPARAARFWTVDETSILPIVTDSELGVIYDGNLSQQGPLKILSLLIYGDTAEAFNLAPLDQARDQITAGLDKLWPGIATEIQNIEFYRYHPRAIAAWPVGRSRFDELSEEIRRPENNLFLAGDFTESSHSDGAFISAHRCVEAILALRAKEGPR